VTRTSDPVAAKKSVLVGTVGVAGGHGIRFSTIMSLLLSLLLTLRSCARSRAKMTRGDAMGV
jgi:hypothetical protein